MQIRLCPRTRSASPPQCPYGAILAGRDRAGGHMLWDEERSQTAKPWDAQYIGRVNFDGVAYVSAPIRGVNRDRLLWITSAFSGI